MCRRSSLLYHHCGFYELPKPSCLQRAQASRYRCCESATALHRCDLSPSACFPEKRPRTKRSISATPSFVPAQARRIKTAAATAKKQGDPRSRQLSREDRQHFSPFQYKKLEETEAMASSPLPPWSRGDARAAGSRSPCCMC